MPLTYAIEHNVNVGAGDHITCLSFSSKDAHVAAGIGSSVYIWELPNANLVLRSPIGSPVTVLKWFATNLLLAGSLEGTLVMYELETNKKVRDLYHDYYWPYANSSSLFRSLMFPS